MPRLRERIRETEELRRLPAATLTEAVDGGITSLLLPRSLGGAGGGLRDFVELIRTLSRGHVSAAWTLSFFAEHNYMLARFPAQAQQVVFPDGRGTLMTGLIHLPRQAQRAEGGYRVTGRWGYATGISHAEWVAVLAVVGGDPPRPMVFLVPRAEVEVADTWHMSGMQGTGSHDVTLNHHYVPEHLAIDFELWSSRQNPGSRIHPEPIYSYALADLLSFLFPAMAVGAAETVLEEFRATIERRHAPFSPQLVADTVGGQIRYARAVSALQAAEATMEHTIDMTLKANESGEAELSAELRGRITLNLLTIMRMAAESVDLSVRGAGSSVFKDGSLTPFFMRDLGIVRSHMALDEDTVLSKAGELLLGRMAGGLSGGEIVRQ